MADLDILCCGELTMDEISIAERISDGHASDVLKSTGHFFGGRAGNFSVYANLLGADARIVSAIADDPEGLEYQKYLSSKKMDLSNLYKNKKAKTCKCFIFNSPDKIRIYAYNGAIRDEPKAYTAHVKSVVEKSNCSTIFCTSPSQEINQIALEKSKAKTKIYAPSSNLHNHSRESIIDCFENTDILFLNHTEADFVEAQLKKSLNEIAKEFDFELLIKTIGAKGSMVIAKGEVTNIPAFAPKKVVDTSGAGDAYAAAFVVNYLKTKDIAYSGKMAAALASIVIEQMGCQTNIPTIQEITARSQGK